jgi:8-oxo-dGTP diphosphatase
MPPPKTPGLAADCVVFDAGNRVLLIRRKNSPFKGRYALPGGFVDIGETVEDACRRELMEETSVKAGKLHLVGVYSGPRRDPRAHNVSVVYMTRVVRATPVAGDDAAAAAWVKDWKSLKLAFDHADIVADAARMLRKSK